MPPARVRAGKGAKGLSTSLADFLDTLDFFDSLVTVFLCVVSNDVLR